MSENKCINCNNGHAPFSVLLSVYEKEQAEWLRESLTSVFEQTVPPSEVVMVEDGPLTPALYAVLDEMCALHPEMKRVPLEGHHGLGLALAEGLLQCSNELVARMDTDDVSRKDRFELQLAEFARNPQLDICGAQVLEFEGTTDNVVSRRRVPLTGDECRRYQRRRDAFNHMTVMYKKSSVLAAGNYQHCPLMEDSLLWVSLFQNNATAMNIDDYLVYARIGKGLYERRGGWAYFQKYRRARKRIYATGFISRWDYLYTLTVQFIVAVIPNRLRSFIYKHLLHS